MLLSIVFLGYNMRPSVRWKIWWRSTHRDCTRSILFVLSFNGCAGFVVLVQMGVYPRLVLLMQAVCKELARSQAPNADVTSAINRLSTNPHSGGLKGEGVQP